MSNPAIHIQGFTYVGYGLSHMFTFLLKNEIIYA